MHTKVTYSERRVAEFRAQHLYAAPTRGNNGAMVNVAPL
jgi:hypothetical protein